MSLALTPSDIPGGEVESGYSTADQLERTIAPTLTAEQETKLWRKIDLSVIPIITFMFLFSFTDRGLAAIDGLMTQLNLTGTQFNTVLVDADWDGCVYTGSQCTSYLVIQVIQDGFQGSWLVMGFVKTYHQLLAMRVCLGAAEAGLYPGVVYYLSSWYPKYKLQYRMALFTGTASLAGAFAGFLGYAITHMNGVGGLETWSWIFNVEYSVKIFDGIGTVLAGIIAAFLMADFPSTAKFLTEGERLIVIEQIGSGAPQDNGHTAVQQVWAAFTDWQVWALSTIVFTMASPSYALSYFLPTIIDGFGYSAAISQVLTIPLYVLSTAAVVVLAHYSDKTQLRSPFIFAGQLVSLVGLANNVRAPYKRATAMAIQLTIGNMSGAIASTIFRSQDAPRYIHGVLLEIIFISVGLIGIPITVFAYKRINAARDREELLLQQQGEDNQHKEEGGGKRIGDRELSFRMNELYFRTESQENKEQWYWGEDDEHAHRVQDWGSRHNDTSCNKATPFPTKFFMTYEPRYQMSANDHGVRVYLGVAEAGPDSGVAYYIMSWYPKYRRRYRATVFTGRAGGRIMPTHHFPSPEHSLKTGKYGVVLSVPRSAVTLLRGTYNSELCVDPRTFVPQGHRGSSTSANFMYQWQTVPRGVIPGNMTTLMRRVALLTVYDPPAGGVVSLTQFKAPAPRKG
ncbi:major facilitator superfamily domain-containing protein [Melanogaster broomeanus]|nr:major facilitator superfamily domain-containing protein [Melanogaster broomeanus]